MFSASRVFLCSVAVAGVVSAATCMPTGFFRDGINMTAVLINPTGTVSGDVDATLCNIGVYYDHGSGKVQKAIIHGANYFGVVVNGDVNSVSVDVVNSNVHDIGEVPLNGTQHGVGIYYRAGGTASASGKITGNTVWNYQKGGIVVNLNSSANISDNIVSGQGPVGYIAQNGIQVGYGANAQVMRNIVSGNAYTGNTDASGGILIVGGDYYGGPYTTGTQVVGNTLVGNDVGVYISNIDAATFPPITATNIKVVNNTITNDAVTNGIPYQTGVSDQGNNDKIINNTISGLGYQALPVDADPSSTNRPKVHANK